MKVRLASFLIAALFAIAVVGKSSPAEPPPPPLPGPQTEVTKPSTQSSPPAFKPPEDELCDWLVARCPYLSSQRARPVDNANHAVKLTVAFIATRFLEINDLEQRFSIQGDVVTMWDMPSCASWNTDKASKLSTAARRVLSCTFKKDKIWHPQLKCLNCLEHPNLIEDFGSDIEVIKAGQAIWNSDGKYDVFCSLSLTKFPNDVQTCTIELITWEMYNFVNITDGFLAVIPEIQGDSLFVADTDRWLLVDTYSQVQISAASLSKVTFYFKMRRKYEQYGTTIFLPITLLMTLQLAGLLVPPRASIRVEYAITVVLATLVFQCFFQTVILPSTSQQMFVNWYIAVQTVIGVLVTVYTLAASNICLMALFKEEVKLPRLMTTIQLIRMIDFGIFIIATVLILTVNIVTYSYVFTPSR